MRSDGFRGLAVLVLAHEVALRYTASFQVEAPIPAFDEFSAHSQAYSQFILSGSGRFAMPPVHYRAPSNSANVKTSVAAAMVTYCLPSAMKVMGEAVRFCPR